MNHHTHYHNKIICLRHMTHSTGYTYSLTMKMTSTSICKCTSTCPLQGVYARLDKKAKAKKTYDLHLLSLLHL